MAVDFTVQMISATFNLEQSLDGGQRRTGSAFLVSAPTPDGAPGVVLVTARHLLSSMPGDQARLGLRVQGADDAWSLQWAPLPVRATGTPLWTEHPTQDVAVIRVKVPPEIASAAIPLDWLAEADSFERYDIGPGDEMVTLGFPCGYSSNRFGFPILRAGRIGSYPLGPVDAFPTFILDFTVLPGHSGGLVFMPEDARRRSGAQGPTRAFVAGVLTQSSERLDLGFVTHAQFVREAIVLMDTQGAVTRPMPPAPPPAAQTAPPQQC